MRVLLVHNRYRSAEPSGENVVVDEEARLLEEHGCTVERVEADSDSIAELSALGRTALPLRVTWSRHGFRLVREAVTAFSPDIVHVHNTFPLLSPATLWAARRSGAAVVQTLHNFRPLCAAGTLLRDGRPCRECVGSAPVAAVRHACYRGSRSASAAVATMIAAHRALGTWHRCVDRFLVPSRFVLDEYAAAGWPVDRMEVKHNTARDPLVRRDGPGRQFVCVARLSPEKGVDDLLRAWSHTFADGAQRLVIVGDGPDAPALAARAGALAGVELRGRLPHAETLAVLGAARAVVVPSRCFEGFPLVVAEAYAAGVPVIAADAGALAEIVHPGRTGYLFAPGSTEALGAALRAFAELDERSLELGRGARAEWETRLSPAVTTARLLAAYGRAIERRRGDAAAATLEGGDVALV